MGTRERGGGRRGGRGAPKVSAMFAKEERAGRGKGRRERGRGGKVFPHLLDWVSEGLRSRCLRFLNQLLTCVRDSPVILARLRFSAGEGYRFCL